MPLHLAKEGSFDLSPSSASSPCTIKCAAAARGEAGFDITTERIFLAGLPVFNANAYTSAASKQRFRTELRSARRSVDITFAPDLLQVAPAVSCQTVSGRNSLSYTNEASTSLSLSYGCRRCSEKPRDVQSLRRCAKTRRRIEVQIFLEGLISCMVSKPCCCNPLCSIFILRSHSAGERNVIWSNKLRSSSSSASIETAASPLGSTAISS